MNTISINLGGAPLATSIHPSIDPVSTGLVGHTREGEGEDTLTASVWARHGGAGGHRGGGGAGGGGAHLLTQGAAHAGVAVNSGHCAWGAGGGGGGGGGGGC